MSNTNQTAKQQPGSKASVLDAIPVEGSASQPLTPKTFLKKNNTVGFCVDVQGGFGGLSLGQVRTLEQVCGPEAIKPLAAAMKAAYDMSQRNGELERLLEAKEQAAKRKAEKTRAIKRGRTPAASTSAAESALDDIPVDA